jgi:hypothetical protein
MSAQHTPARVALLAFALPFALIASACDGLNLAVGSVVSPAPFVGTTLVPSPILFHSIPAFGCPIVPPFHSQFTIAIDQTTGVDLFLDTLDLRFHDTTGLASAVIFSRSELSGLFGHTRVPTGIRRSFDFRTRFGCGLVGRPHSVVGVLIFFDGRGGTHRSTVTARLH